MYNMQFCSATLVNTEAYSSALQVQCLVEWTMGGGLAGRPINIGGAVSQVRECS